MAIALTEVSNSAMVYNDGNKLAKKYTLAFTGTYPNGGYPVANSQYPGSTQIFKHILRVNPAQGGFNDDGVFIKIDPDGIDNSDTTNPTFTIKVFAQETGGGLGELAAGVNFISSAEFVIDVVGVKKGGVVGSVN